MSDKEPRYTLKPAVTVEPSPTGPVAVVGLRPVPAAPPVGGVKQIICSGPGCDNRRVHWMEPFTPRGPVKVIVPDDYEGPAYCSIECSLRAKYASAEGDIRAKSGERIEEQQSS